MIINRDLYLDQIIERKHNRLIKIVTGIRRCGKTFLLNELFVKHLFDSGVSKDHVIQISVEGIANSKFKDPDYVYRFITDQMLDDSMYYIIIDEVQEINNFIDLLIGLMILKNADVYVTGSNSRFLSTDIATEFRGRSDVIELHPLRFSEFVSQYSNIDESWDDYITYGGMPQILTYKTAAAKEKYLSDLFSSSLERDVFERNGIKKENEFDDLINVLASGIGSLTNANKLEKTYKSEKHVSFPHTTIDKYIDYLEEAFIVRKSLKYDVKGRRYIGTPYKIYFEDIGLRNARLNFRQIEENHIMENIIFNELRARGYKSDVGIVEHYKKDPEGKTIRIEYEVDFVVNKGSERYYIQSAFEISNEEKMNQEKNSLRNIGDSFKKIIIEKGYIKPKIDEDGIIRIGLINFLLDDKIIS